MCNLYIPSKCTNCAIGTFLQNVQIAQFVHAFKMYKLGNLYNPPKCTNCTISTFLQNVKIT